MELTREARLDMIAAGHRRWIRQEQAKLSALFAARSKQPRKTAVDERDEDQELDAYGPLAFDEVGS